MTSTLLPFFLGEDAFAWGPAVHTVTALSVLGDLSVILPAVADALRFFSWEFIYGCLAADFFIGKGHKDHSKHPHNWEGGFTFLQKARDEQERSFAYGFLSHLAADVVSHHLYVPKFITDHKDIPFAGHAYAELVADSLVGPGYIKLARKSLARELPACDELINIIASAGERNMKVRKGLYREGLRLSDYFFTTREMLIPLRNCVETVDRPAVAFHVGLACEAVKDLLSGANRLPSLKMDPVGPRKTRFRICAEAVRRGTKLLFKKSYTAEKS